jgi:hypothetical protein
MIDNEPPDQAAIVSVLEGETPVYESNEHCILLTRYFKLLSKPQLLALPICMLLQELGELIFF